MPAFGRVNGAWVQGDLRQRANGEWTDERDNVYARVDGAWVQVQPEPQDLLPPENLLAVATSNEATLTWTNPTQDVTPTDVQIRIPEITPVWTELVYPTTLLVWAALAASTNYQFQVRYIVREDGEVTLTSPTASAFFTTDALAGPGIPAPDPGGGGGSTVDWPSLPGGGTVGSGGCWYEWILQEFVEAGLTGGNWEDTAITGDEDGTGLVDLAVDFGALGVECGSVLRYKWREVCNGVPGDYEFNPVFTYICDATANCGGVAISTRFTGSTFADAIFAMPQVCYRAALGESVIEDYISEEIYGKLPGYGSYGFGDGQWNVSAKFGASDTGAAIIAGDCAALGLIDETTDLSITLSVRLQNQPLDDISGGTRLAVFGKRITVRAYEEGAGYRIGVVFPKMGGGSYSLQSTTELPLSEWQLLVLTIDQDGDKVLYVDGDADVTDTDTTAAKFDDISDELELYGNQNAAIRVVGGWDRILTAEEISLLDGYDAILLGMGPLWYSTLDEQEQDEFYIWPTYAEGIAGSIHRSAPYGPAFTPTWTIEYLAMEWPTLAVCGTDDALLKLGPEWFDAFLLQAAPIPTYDDMLENEIGAIWYAALDGDTGTADPIGGTITDAGGYRYHTFITTGQNSTVLLDRFYVGTAGTLTVDALIIGGGGSGGRGAVSGRGGGGGAGGYIELTAYDVTDVALVRIGAGGSNNPSANGGQSEFDGNIADGGGFGGNNTGVNGGAGGSGGGGGGVGASNGTGGTATVGQGNDGGDAGASNGGGGGGGASTAGADGVGSTPGGGGAGLAWVDGVTRAGGGGGAISGAGGAGGGGNGATAFGSGVSGAANTGSGGGGSFDFNAPGRGGNGVVIIRYLI